MSSSHVAGGGVQSVVTVGWGAPKGEEPRGEGEEEKAREQGQKKRCSREHKVMRCDGAVCMQEVVCIMHGGARATCMRVCVLAWWGVGARAHTRQQQTTSSRGRDAVRPSGRDALHAQLQMRNAWL